MPKLTVAPGLETFYRQDAFGPPWAEADDVVLVHGIAESSRAWYAWVPILGQRFRLLRPDLRGFGRSTPMPTDFAWSLERLSEDLVALADRLGVERFHLVGAKLGGTVAMRLAAAYADRVRTVSVVGSPVSATGPLARKVPVWLDTLARDGAETWAAAGMDERLGSAFPTEGKAWWGRMMAEAPSSSIEGIIRALPGFSVEADLARIRCPTLIVTGTGGGLGEVDEIRAWQTRIPDSELAVVPTDAYHVAAAEPARAAALVRDFIARRG